LRFIPSGYDRASGLRVVRGVAASVGARVVNPKWTSYGALEVDVFAEAKGDFETFVAAIEPLGKVEFARDLQETQPYLPKEETVAQAVFLFNAERFWEAHEVLESLWRVAQGEEKDLLQGLILVCAAFVHLQKGEPEVALGVARRSIPKLAWAGPAYNGISVADVRERVRLMVDGLALSRFEL
jgi:hypothetical protein